MTATEPRSFPSLSPEQTVEVLGLVGRADTVELKLTIAETEQRSAVRALGMDPLDAQIRQVFFFDTPDLALSGNGVVARARRSQGRSDDSVVKLRPVDPADLPSDLRTSPNLGVEVDAMPGGFVCSASMKRALDGRKHVKRVMAGSRAIHKLFSKEQRAFFKAYAPDGMEIDDLSRLGPITLLKLRFSPKGFHGRLVAELWLYPDGSRVLELSTKCLSDEVLEVAASSREFLTERGVDLTGEQQTKTRTSLDFYSKELRRS